MKQVLYILTFFTLLAGALASCTKDDDNRIAFREPFLRFGATVADVSAAEYRNLARQDSVMLIYESATDSEKSVAYAFRNDSLAASVTYLEGDPQTAKKLITFLDKKYTSLTTDKKTRFYTNPTNHTLIVVDCHEEYITILYTPFGTDNHGNEAGHSIKTLYDSRLALFR
ncbi:hypothetical protein M2132_001137 [Dysgonomonas sp. PH5-45]|uniref:hypothetical protein n=1 Tax=unclassified Dysgonomonas TaxID=2630389 RepID=UPI002474012E|nr:MULTISPECIES: hypothetical protein [unclassified Dysgonomonas]MDH6354806.1 hypothetical protein [Dysgonomonas sp. PH5-45]MDH6387705.1 hypothetical protein [Dysgonomonas sp. PH5-37]